MGASTILLTASSRRSSLLGSSTLDVDWGAGRKSSELSEGLTLLSIVLESKSFDGLGGVIYFLANWVVTVLEAGLRGRPIFLRMVTRLVGQTQVEHSSELLSSWLTGNRDTNCVAGLAGVVEAGQIVWSVAPLVALPLGQPAVVSLGKSPDNTVWLTHLLHKVKVLLPYLWRLKK